MKTITLLTQNSKQLTSFFEYAVNRYLTVSIRKEKKRSYTLTIKVGEEDYEEVKKDVQTILINR